MDNVASETISRRTALQRAGLMLGYAISGPALAGILNGCKARPGLAFKPVFLSEPQAAIVSEIAEIFIPHTDTPGAKDTGVPAFIDLMLKDVYPAEDQQRFLKGLDEFEAQTKASEKESFIDLSPEKQVERVRSAQADAINATKPGEKRPFILMTKELTLLGFFTSEPGATQVLQYSAVPTAYHGCVPLKEVGKAWATP